MKSVLSVLAPVLVVVSGLSFATQEAWAFTTITVDASGPDGAARFRDPDKLTESHTSARDPAGTTNLFQSRDGKFSVKAGFQQGSSGFGSPSIASRKSFNDYIPTP